MKRTHTHGLTCWASQLIIQTHPLADTHTHSRYIPVLWTQEEKEKKGIERSDLLIRDYQSGLLFFVSGNKDLSRLFPRVFFVPSFPHIKTLFTVHSQNVILQPTSMMAPAEASGRFVTETSKLLTVRHVNTAGGVYVQFVMYLWVNMKLFTFSLLHSHTG